MEAPLIWNLKVPPHVRVFLRRTAHQCLPTRDNLSNCSIPYTESCVSYDLIAESHIHTFLVCSKAIEGWDKIGIGTIIREMLLGANNFSTMLFDLFSRLKEQDKLSASITLWSFWKSRNAKLLDSTDSRPTSIITCAHDVLHEWSCLQKAKHLTRLPDQQLVWIKPQLGHIKCNVDAAFFNNNETMAYGMCFRDSTCTLLFCKSDYMHYSCLSWKQNLLVFYTLKTAISNGFHNVTFETDIKTLVDTLSAHNVPLNEFGDPVFECKSLLFSNSDYVVSFVRRQSNRVTHSIAPTLTPLLCIP